MFKGDLVFLYPPSRSFGCRSLDLRYDIIYCVEISIELVTFDRMKLKKD